MWQFGLGCYITGAMFMTGVSGMFVALGGNSRDLWKPIVHGLMWPVLLPYLLFTRFR